MRFSGLTILSVVVLVFSLPALSPCRLSWNSAEAGAPLYGSPGSAFQSPKQPKVAPGPGEPDWDVILRERYGLSMFDDLKNPVKTTAVAAPDFSVKPGTGPFGFGR